MKRRRYLFSALVMPIDAIEHPQTPDITSYVTIHSTAHTQIPLLGISRLLTGCSNGTRPGFRDVWPTFAGATDGQESRRWQRSSTRMKGNGDTLPLGTIQDPGRPLHVGYETRGL